MNDERKTIKIGSRSFVSTSQLLLILFVALKLTGQIDWSWWWVLAPLWIPWAIVGVLLVAGAVLIGFGKLLVTVYDRRSRKRLEEYRRRYNR